MNVTNKRVACRVLGNEQLFPDEVVAKYLSESTYRDKSSWIQKIQSSGQTAHYATVLPSDLSKCQRKEFKDLCVLQLQYMLKCAENVHVARYLRVMLILNDGSHISKRNAMEQIANRLEKEIIRCCSRMETCPGKADARSFLFAAALLADKNNLYDAETSAAFQVLCRIAE